MGSFGELVAGARAEAGDPSLKVCAHIPDWGYTRAEANPRGSPFKAYFPL
jgi:hypothetical protein